MEDIFQKPKEESLFLHGLIVIYGMYTYIYISDIKMRHNYKNYNLFNIIKITC